MAGNTVYMQPGSKYIDIHDNEVVNVALSERGANLFATPSQRNVTESNLNIDKATLSVDKGEIAQKMEKNPGGRPKRAGTPINKAFIYDADDETNVRLQLFYNGLKVLGWIREDTDLRDFLSIFSGDETTCRIVWTGDINALAGLFKELITLRKFVKLPEGETIWVMVNARFWEREGNKEFGNERLGSTHPPIDLKDDIALLVDIMNPETSLKEIRERLQSQ